MPPSAKKQRTEPGSAGSSSNDMEPPEETVSVRRMRRLLARCDADKICALSRASQEPEVIMGFSQDIIDEEKR